MYPILKILIQIMERNWRGELVVRVGWRLTDRSLGREEGEWGFGDYWE